MTSLDHILEFYKNSKHDGVGLGAYLIYEEAKKELSVLRIENHILKNANDWVSPEVINNINKHAELIMKYKEKIQELLSENLPPLPHTRNPA